jgi:DNA polymerase/3'-5' exonuclease PolX
VAATETRLHRPEAVAIARAFVDALDGCYTELKVAGSLRRRLAYVGDVEIVCVPRLEALEGGLFGDAITHRNRLEDRLQALLEHDEITQRKDTNGATRWGPTLKFLTFQGARIDLFCPSAERFGWILLLRTGPAAFSRQLVVRRGQRTKDGRPGLLPARLLPRDGWLTWRVSGERIATPTEQHAFDALDLPYVEPWERR